ncbi:MAG: transposase [Deltaproteobacteria bacterium]|nr:transposase [Deltaproteobacteria bacterium]
MPVGSSPTYERIQLIKLFIKASGKERVKYITSDCEFIGQEWLCRLLYYEIPIRCRIKENNLVTNSRGEYVPAKDFFRGLKPGEVRLVEGERLVFGVNLFVVGTVLSDGEYLIIVTDQEPETAMDDYKQRWEIEFFFGCLKTRWFRFESTHITDPERISKMLAPLAIAFCWRHLAGEWMAEQKAIKIKKHGRKGKSIFRYGLTALRDALSNPSYRKIRLIKVINILTDKLSNIPPILLVDKWTEILSRT